MRQELDNINQYISESERILITAHISPDGDSVSSSLLLYQILKLNFPQKSITVSMEEKPFGLSFLNGYEDIIFKPLKEILGQTAPDLLFILDSNAIHRITRDTESVDTYLAQNKTRIAVIDHHQGLDIENVDIYVNNHSAAVTLDIYDIFIEQLGMKKPTGYAQTALTGIYTDTGGFVHQNLNFKRVFEVVPQLMADGADIETIAAKLNQLSLKSMEVLKELLLNAVFTDSYTYSFISDETAVIENHEAIVQATEAFRTQFLRSVEARPWGFIVYRDVMAKEQTYSVSFRALSEAKDVSILAKSLGGGGHKPAAGAKFSASNVEDALAKVLETIDATSTS